MKYNKLADTGLLVSELCFGTMTFGGVGRWKPIGELGLDEAVSLIKMSVNAGINFFDTANAYSFGTAEEILGNAFKKLGVDRSEVVLASKVRARMADGPNQIGLSRVHILDSLDKSLKRLQTDYLDVFYIHGVDPITSLDEIMRTLNDVVRSGKVRYLGVSNHPAWMVAKANGVAYRNAWEPFKLMQYLYALSTRDAEFELIPMSQSENIAFLPWSPLAGGFLSGKFDRETERAGGSRRDDFDFPPINKEKVYAIIDVMRDLAKEKNVTVAQVALRWVMQSPGVTCTIIGARTQDQLRDNIETTAFELSDAEMETLNAVSYVPKPYPAWMVDYQMRGRFPE